MEIMLQRMHPRQAYHPGLCRPRMLWTPFPSPATVLWRLILLALPNICRPICDTEIGVGVGIGIGIGHCKFTIVRTFSEPLENNPSAVLHPSRFLSFSSPLHSFVSICSQWLFH